MRIFLIIIGALILAVAVRMSVYTVDAAEYAYVTILGRHVDTFDGQNLERGAGLHIGWPWPFQAVLRIDRRLQAFDLPATELLTRDQERGTVDKTLSVEAYVCWRIPDAQAVDRFIKSMGTTETAKEILGKRINAELGNAFGKMKMDDLVSIEPGKAPGATHVDEKMAELRGQLLGALQKQVLDEYGIELLDIRLKRFSYPGDTRQAIFERIRSERKRKVTEFISEGERQARNIESDAEEKVRNLLSQARFEEEKLKGEADTQAMLIRNQAHSQDPGFYGFLKKMDTLQSVLGDNRAVLLLSTHRGIFDLLFQPPRPNGPAGPTNNGSNGSKKN